MTRAIDTVFIGAILAGLLRGLGLPETLPLIKLSPRMQKWIVDEAACLQRDAMSHPTFALLVEYGLPLTRENYLDINNLNEGNLDTCGWKPFTMRRARTGQKPSKHTPLYATSFPIA